MFEVVGEIPKEYERSAIEKYYYLFCDMSRVRKFFRPKIRFELNKENFSQRELNDIELQQAIRAVDNRYDSFKFVLLKTDAGVIAIARTMFYSSTIQVKDLIFLDYPNEEEKEDITESYLEYFDSNLLDKPSSAQKKVVYWEVPKTDDTELKRLLNIGFNRVIVPKESENKYKTYLLEREVKEREKNGWTRCRKQANWENQPGCCK